MPEKRYQRDLEEDFESRKTRKTRFHYRLTVKSRIKEPGFFFLSFLQ
jgi:hypothetical protein